MASGRRERDARLRSARVVVLLVSGDYLASDHLHENEVAPSVARAVPVLVRPCGWEDARFAHRPRLPRNGVPVTSWAADRDEAWADAS